METGSAAGTVISAALVLGALVLKVTDLIKYLAALTKDNDKSRDEGRNGLLALAVAAAGGLVAVFVFRETEWADEITIGTERLADLNLFSTVVFGVVAASIASTLYDFKKAIDPSETSSTPRFTEKAEQDRLRYQEAHFQVQTRGAG